MDKFPKVLTPNLESTIFKIQYFEAFWYFVKKKCWKLWFLPLENVIIHWLGNFSSLDLAKFRILLFKISQNWNFYSIESDFSKYKLGTFLLRTFCKLIFFSKNSNLIPFFPWIFLRIFPTVTIQWGISLLTNWEAIEWINSGTEQVGAFSAWQKW